MEILKEILITILAWTLSLSFIIGVFYVIIREIYILVKGWIDVYKGKPTSTEDSASLPWEIRKLL